VRARSPELETLKGVAASCPGFQARATARALTRYFNAHFKKLELTAEQFSLLVGIASEEGATLVNLAASAGIDPTTLSRNLAGLESRGIVVAKGGRGRLGKQLSLTKNGWQLISKALPIWSQANDELSARIGKDILKTTTKHMAFLANSVRQS
jgi:DNA-binding MarR family transcriptional regulator